MTCVLQAVSNYSGLVFLVPTAGATPLGILLLAVIAIALAVFAELYDRGEPLPSTVDMNRPRYLYLSNQLSIASR